MLKTGSQPFASASKPAARPHFGVYLGLACTVGLGDPLIASSAMAHGAAPAMQPNFAAPLAHTSFSHATHQTFSNTVHANAVTNSFAALQNAAGHAGSANGNLTHSGAWHNSAHLMSQLRAGAAAGTTGLHDLNLSSSAANIAASSLAGFRDLTLVIGGVRQVFSLDSKLTGAEAVAAEQVLQNGNQTIKIAADGSARGGSVLLNTAMVSALSQTLGGNINTLTIAHGVKVVDSMSLLSLTGNLDNYGKLLTASSTANGVDTIAADNIVNARGGVLGSYSGGQGLYGADLLLSAQTAITNSGVISSQKDLTLSAPSLQNSGTISAGRNVNLNTTNLLNQALIYATAGNINVSGYAGSSVTADNDAGTIAATRGNINFATTGGSDITLSGGDYNSKQLNLSAGTGNITVGVNDASGVINADGNCVHIITSGDQILGNINASGDPQAVSTSGNITIDGTIAVTGGADLAILAAGNVVSGSKSLINLSNISSGNGGNLTIVAGANVVGDTTKATVSGASPTGGIIDLTGKNGGSAAVTAITTSGTGTAGNGGYIEMVAYQGTATGSGAIVLPSKVTVNAAGSGTGANGNVTLIAGATSGTSITTGAIVGKQITLLTQTPQTNGTITFTNGTSSKPGTDFTGTGTAQAASIVAGALTSSQGITVASGANVTLGKATADGAASAVDGGTGAVGGTIAVTAGGNILSAELDAFGAGGNGGGSTTANGGAGGNGGTISLISGGNIAVTGNINVSGGGGGGGVGSNITKTAGSGGAGGKGGTVNLNAASAASVISVSGEVLAYNGGAGGAGGAAGGVGAGGGGGGGGSFGGAGGGGAAGSTSSAGNSATGGGGGGSALAPGGGGAGSSGNGNMAHGGFGGGYIALGAGGTATIAANNGSSGAGTKGGNGGKASTLAAGAGGAAPSGGSPGKTTASNGVGIAGSQALIQAGSGTLAITAGGSAGTTKAALKFEAGSLTVASTSAASSVYLNDVSGAGLTVGAAAVGATGIFSLSNQANSSTGISGGTVNLTQVVSGGAFVANLQGGLTTSGASSIQTTSAALTAASTINVSTNVGSLTVVEKGDNVTITQGTNALTLAGASSVLNGDSLMVTSAGNITVAGTVSGGAASALSLTDTGTTAGINILGSLSAGAVSLTANGSAGITAAATGKITSGFVQLTSASDIGSVKAPIFVGNNLASNPGNEIDIKVGSTNSAYIAATGAGALLIAPQNASSGTLSVSSTSAAMTISQAVFANVTFNDTASGSIIIAGAVGNGNGAVSISSGGKIVMDAAVAPITGTAVTLTSTSGSIGDSTNAILVNSNTLTANALKGSLYITESATGVVSFTGNALTNFNLTESASNDALQINSAVTANAIQIYGFGSSSDIITMGPIGTAASSTVSLAPSGTLIVLNTVAGNTVSLGGFAVFGSPTTVGVIEVDGKVTAGEFFSILAPSAAAININAPITAGTSIRISATQGSNQGVNINANIGTASTEFVGIVVSGDINAQPGTVVAAQTLGLNGATVGNALAPITTRAADFTLHTVGDAYVNNTGTTSLSVGSNGNSGTLVFNNNGALALTSDSNVVHDNITITATGAINIGNINDFSAVLQGNSSLTLGAVGAISNYATLSAPDVTVIASSFANIVNSLPDVQGPAYGNVLFSNSLTMSNATAGLSISGPNDSIIYSGSGGSLNLSAKGAIAVGNNINNPLEFAVNNGQLHSIIVNATGALSATWNNFQVVADGAGNGGTVSITANNYNYVGGSSNPIVIDASGSTAVGATVVLNLFGSTSITTGNGHNQYDISANGANGASVEIDTAGTLTADMNHLLFNGAGNGAAANITLNAGGKLLVDGNLDTHTGSGAYGRVVLSSGGTTAFVIGGDASTTKAGIINDISSNGVLGSDVTIITGGALTVNAGQTILAKTGDIYLGTPNLINNGTINTTQTLSVVSSPTLQFGASGLGTLNSAMKGLDLISTNGSLTIPTLPTGLSELALSAPKGTITIPSTITGLSVSDANGSGGTINFTASAVKATLPFSFNAAAKNAAAGGGTINFALTGTSAQTIGAATYTFDVAKGASSTNGGTLSIANNGNLIVDASAAVLNLGSGKGTSGGNLTLIAGSTGKGTLLVSNASALANQSINDLTLNSNSPTAMTLGGATTKTNGIVDAGIAIDAQSVTLQNNGGAITQGSGGTVTANGTTSGALSLTAGKGGIGFSHAAPLTVAASNIAISTVDNAFIVDNNASVALDGLSAGKSFDYTGTGAIVSAVRMSAPTFTINVGSLSTALNVNAGSLSVTTQSGNIQISDAATKITATTLSTQAGTVAVFGGGSLTTLATSTIKGSSIDLEAGGTAGALIIGGSLNASGTITLASSGKGTLTAAKGVVLTATDVNLNSSGGNIGTSHTNAINIDASQLTVNTTRATTTASAFVKDTAASVALGASTVANVFDYTGAITSNTGSVDAKSLLLAVTNFSAPILATTASSITASAASGNIRISDTQTGLLTLQTITTAPGTGDVVIVAGGGVTAAGLITAAGGISLTALGSTGNITVNKALTSTAGDIDLTTSGTGAIVAAGGTLTGLSANLATAGGNIGASNKALALVTSTSMSFITGTTGDVYITNTDKVAAGNITLTTSNVGSLKLTETNANANTGTLMVGTVTTHDGALTIASNEQTLQVNGNLTAGDGNLTLQNTFTASKTALPLLQIANNVHLHATALDPGNLAAGNVYVVLGAVPAASALRPGVTPTPAPAITGTGTVTYGSTANTAGSITTGTGDTLNLLARNIIFSTGKNASSQIVLGNNVIMTADPPVGLVATSSLAAGNTYVAAPGASITAPGALTTMPAALILAAAAPTVTAALNTFISNAANFSFVNQSIANQSTANQSTANSGSTYLSGAVSKQSTKKQKENINQVELVNGLTLYAPDKDTQLNTRAGVVDIARGAVVLVIASANTLALYDLHDGHSHAVSLTTAGGEKVTLSPGRTLVMAHAQGERFEEANPIDQVAYRRLQTSSNHGAILHKAEFDICTLMRAIKPVKDMITSESAQTRRVAGDILKTAAILNQLSGASSEAYQLHPAPAVTACNMSAN